MNREFTNGFASKFHTACKKGLSNKALVLGVISGVQVSFIFLNRCRIES